MPVIARFLRSDLSSLRCTLAAQASVYPGIGAGIGAHLPMDTTLNYAIGVIVLAGALALAIAIMVW
jgi:hypothetical protein